VFTVFGYGISAVAGLAMGYLLIKWLFPDSRVSWPW